MWRERKALLRLVAVFLVGCAVVGFIMGVRGALPPGGDAQTVTGPVSAPSSAVIIEAAPLEEAIVTPPAEPEKTEPEEEEEAEEDEKAEEAEAAEAPETAPAPKTPAPKAKAAPPPPAPEKTEPEDPVGDLLEVLPPDAVIY